MIVERMKRARFSPYQTFTVPLSELFIGGCVFDDGAKDFALACGVNVVELCGDEWSVVRSSTSKGGSSTREIPNFMFSWRKGMACKASNPESDQSLTRFITTLGTTLQPAAQHHETLRTFPCTVFKDFSTSRVDVSIERELMKTGGYWWYYYTGRIEGHFAGDPSTWKLGGHGCGKTSRGKREGSNGEELEENQPDGFSAQKEKCITAIYRHLVAHKGVWVDLEDCEVDSDGNLFFVWKFMKPLSIEAAGSKGTVDLIYLADRSVAVVQVEPHVTRNAIGRLLGTRRLAEKRLDKAMNGSFASCLNKKPSSELFIGGCVFDDGVKDFALACGVSVVELREEWPIVQNSIPKGGRGRC